jgi:hypothetical protein
VVREWLPLGQEIEKELGNVVSYDTIMRYLNEQYKREYTKVAHATIMGKSIEKTLSEVTKKCLIRERLGNGKSPCGRTRTFSSSKEGS